MKIKKLQTAILAAAVIGSVSVASAQITGSLWENVSSQDASQPLPTSTPQITFTTPAIDFISGGDGSSAAYTMGGFLFSEVTPTILTGSGDLGDSMYDGSGNTLIDLTGTIYLSGGTNDFQIGHDDGVDLTVSGATVTGADDPGPTSFALTPFTIDAPTGGYYSYNVEYMEVDGPPAALEWAYPSGAPVGAPDSSTTMGLLGLSLGGLAAFGRRFRK